MHKVTVIGLDGGSYAVIDHLVAHGRLPNFARLMEKGSRGDLLSTRPPVTWPAWASFYTGTNPGKTGAADLFKFRPGTYQLEPMNAGNLRGTPIWSQAGSRGKRVCIYNVPVTYPAIPVNGVLISGLDAPRFNDQAIYPLELKEKLMAAVPDFQISFENDAKYMVTRLKDPVGEWIRQLKAYLEMELRTIDYLMKMEDWDLFVSVIRSTDIFQHTLWHDAEKVISGKDVTAEEQRRAEAVFACYDEIDARFGESASAWGTGRNLIVMSDHGFGLLRGTVCVNRVLEAAGLLRFRPAGERSRSDCYILSKLKANMPLSARQKIKRLLGKEESRERWSSYVDILVADIDWEHTKIFSVGGFGCLFLNLKGRDPLGAVDEMERQEVLAAAEAALSGLRHPDDGEPMVTEFYRKEELYQGPFISEVPDLVINMRDWSYCPVIGTANELSEEAIIRPPVKEWKELAHTGTHRREGILFMDGPDISQTDFGEVQMVDVAPTIMNLLGLPEDENWDGRIIAKALKGGAMPVEAGPEYEHRQSVEAASVYSEEDEDEVRKRLEDLGYL